MAVRFEDGHCCMELCQKNNVLGGVIVITMYTAMCTARCTAMCTARCTAVCTAMCTTMCNILKPALSPHNAYVNFFFYDSRNKQRLFPYSAFTEGISDESILCSL